MKSSGGILFLMPKVNTQSRERFREWILVLVSKNRFHSLATISIFSFFTSLNIDDYPPLGGDTSNVPAFQSPIYMSRTMSSPHITLAMDRIRRRFMAFRTNVPVQALNFNHPHTKCYS